MTLFLPASLDYSGNPSLFDVWLLKQFKTDRIKKIDRIYMFPMDISVKKEQFNKANIEIIIVPNDGSYDNDLIKEIGDTDVIYFSDFLNERMITVLKILNNKVGYYRNYSERRYITVEDHELLFEVFEQIAHLKGTEENEKLTKEFVPQYSTKSLFESFCPNATKKLFSGKKYFYIYHSEKILFDKLVSYLESLTKSKARFESATISMEEQRSPKSNKKINIVVYSSSSSLTQNRKSLLMSQSEELYPNARWIIFNESSNNPTSDFLPEYCEIITLPDYEQIKTNHSLTEIFNLLIIEFARANNHLISYSTFDVNGDKLINTFFSPFDSLTDMYNTLKEIHPSGNFTIHSWQPDYWYNLLSAQKRIAENKSDEDKPIEIDFKSKELSADQSKTELTSAISDKKVPKIVEGSETQYPNRFEKKDELISIYYNGLLIPHINSTLIGLRYIYLIIKYVYAIFI